MIPPLSHILVSLPHDYNSLTTTVNTQLESFHLDELYGHLLTHNCILNSGLSLLQISLLQPPTLLPSCHNLNFVATNLIHHKIVDEITLPEAEDLLNFCLPLITQVHLVPFARYVLRLITPHRAASTILIRTFKSPPTNLHKLLLFLHLPMWTRLGTHTLVPTILSIYQFAKDNNISLSFTPHIFV